MAAKDELDLIYGLKTNQEHYQKLLVDKYSGLLLIIVMGLGLSREDSLEVVNETFYKAIKSIDSFDIKRETKLSRWLVKIAKNTAIDLYRKEKKSPIDQSLEEREEKGIQDTANLAQPTVSHKSDISLLAEKLLKKALKNLNVTDQNILMERAWGLEYKQISLHTNKTVNALKVAHTRALKKLKEEYISLLESLDNLDKKEALTAHLYNEGRNEEAAN